MADKKGTLCAVRFSGYYRLFLDINDTCTNVLKQAYMHLGNEHDSCTFLETDVTMTMLDFGRLILDVGKYFKTKTYTLTDIVHVAKHAVTYYEKRKAFLYLGHDEESIDDTKENVSTMLPDATKQESHVYCLYNTFAEKCIFIKAEDGPMKVFLSMCMLHDFEKIMQLPQHMSSVCDEVYSKIKSKRFQSKLALCDELFKELNHSDIM